MMEIGLLDVRRAKPVWTGLDSTGLDNTDVKRDVDAELVKVYQRLMQSCGTLHPVLV